MADHRWVAQVRDLLNESAREAPKNHDLRGFYAPTVSQQPRARHMREINRIIVWYGLESEVVRALDRARVERFEDLSTEDVARLRRRLVNLEDCIQNGLGAPDAPPGF